MTTRGLYAWKSPYLVVALVGLVLYAWGFALQCGKSQLPPDFNIDACRFPVTTHGVAAASAEQLRFVVEGWDIGEEITIVDATGASRNVVLAPAASLSLLLVTVVSGFLFWLVCFVVFVPRIREPVVPQFFWILMLYGLAVMIGGVFFQRRLLSAGSFFAALQIICLAALPLTFLLLTLRFPRRQPTLDHRCWLMPLLWSVAVGLVAWQVWAYGRLFATPSLGRLAATVVPEKAADLFMLAIVGVGFANLIRQIRCLEDVRQVKQIRWLLWGFAVGAAPYLALRTLPQLLGLPAPLPAGADRVLEMAVPLAFVCAVVWEQLLDIDVIIRRSLLYSALATVVLGLMLVPSLVLTWSFGELRPNAYRVALLCGGLAAGIVFSPLRRQLGAMIDRWVFNLARDGQSLLAELDRLLQTVLVDSDVTDVLESAMKRWFGCEVATLVLCPGGLPAGGDILAAAEASELSVTEAGSFPEPWAASGFVVALRVSTSGLQYGWLLIGQRGTGRRYLNEDLELCRRSAARAAQALDRLRLIREKNDEAHARQQLDDLNRMKSEFLAHVAHDLRTPITAISWSVRNLLDGLAGDVAETQRTYLSSVSDAASHLNTLVNNLLELSQLERAATALPLTTFDPMVCVNRSVSTVTPLAHSARVALSVTAAAAPTVRAHPDKLMEVMVNILDNAIKYSPPEGRVLVHAGTDDRGWFSVSVTDEGSGFRDLDDPFARFSQGRPSSHSRHKGFGLGLYIVRQYVQLMHGEVSGDNTDSGGARVALRLPPGTDPF